MCLGVDWPMTGSRRLWCLLLRGEPRADWQLHDIVQAVLVSIIMNMFAFSYSALIAPIGLDVYRVSPILVGALAAAEPLAGCGKSSHPAAIGRVTRDITR